MTMRRLFSLAVLLSACAATMPVRAQQPAPAPAAPAPATPPALPSPPPNFQYNPEGRRDPFVDLVNRGADTVRGNNPSAKRPEGAAGLETNALTVRGIMQSRGAWLAMVAGPDGKVFTVRAGDKLFDGVIRTITAQAVVILQEVNDPLSLEKQREVRKFLRGGEEVK
jgi:Tfp pilus assembly protein PilP